MAKVHIPNDDGHTAGLALFKRAASYAATLLDPSLSIHARILLVHPTGGPPMGSWSIPKGHIEPGETIKQAALREVQEEVGLIFPFHRLSGNPGRLYWEKHRKQNKRVLYYWIVDVTHWDLPNELPMRQLQHEEVDIARFIELNEAGKFLTPKQIPLLHAVAKAAGI